MSFQASSRTVTYPGHRYEPRSKMKQNYTAIQVDDPYKQNNGASTDPGYSRTTINEHRSGDSNDGLRDLLARQDQLLSHQMQVASRQDEIASHLANQNNALNDAMLKQVLANKDNMIAKLANAQASEWDDNSKELLAKHIRYIVAFIQRLNSDISALESEIKGRDLAVIGTNNAVNKLEVHHVTMLQDVRSRIVRAEQAISKHSKDIASLIDENRRLEGQIIVLREKLGQDIHRVEAEVISMTGELERQNSQQQAELSHFRGNINQQLALMEERMKAMMAQFRDGLDDNKAGISHHLDRMDAKFKAMIDKATAGWADLMKQVDRRIDENLMSIMARLQKLEERMKYDRGQLNDLQQSIETQVMATLQDTVAYNNAELSKAKNEFRKGFAELQDSLANLKGVVEGKRKILAHEVRREIGAVKRAVYSQNEQPQEEGNLIVVRNVKPNDGW